MIEISSVLMVKSRNFFSASTKRVRHICHLIISIRKKHQNQITANFHHVQGRGSDLGSTFIVRWLVKVIKNAYFRYGEN